MAPKGKKKAKLSSSGGAAQVVEVPAVPALPNFHNPNVVWHGKVSVATAAIKKLRPLTMPKLMPLILLAKCLRCLLKQGNTVDRFVQILRGSTRTSNPF